MMVQKNTNAKDIMLVHSKAKVDFYQRYLEIYLSIMSKVTHFDTICIWDVFCGRGVYKGGLGSPIRAVETIKKVREQCGNTKKIRLYLNDKNEKHITSVRNYIEEHFPDWQDYCYISYTSIDAEVILENLCKSLRYSLNTERHLIFIDPYGYKNIHKDILDNLMSNNHTEILLFLPISFMHRFRNYAFQEDCNEGAKRLREFIESYFSHDHPVCKEEEMDVKTYIKHLTHAFTYSDKYYATSYHIARDSKNYFALFFICRNLLSFEKVMEVKWKLDGLDGDGFEQPKPMRDLFEKVEQEERRNELMENLRLKLISHLSCKRTNADIYEYVLRQEYLPKHANEILRELQNNNSLKVTLVNNGKIARKGAFYLNYKDSKTNGFPKAIIELIK